MEVAGRRVPALVMAAILLAACGSSATATPSSEPSAPTEAPSAEPTDLVETEPPPEETPTPAVETPSPEPIVLDGRWVSPTSGATIKAYAIALAAVPTSSSSDVAITKVVFTASWSGTKKTACTARAAGSGGAWRCSASLLTLGPPLGKVTFTFDVYDAAGNRVRSPAGSRAITYKVKPPDPTKVIANSRTGTVKCPGTTTDCRLADVAWHATGPVTSFRVYVAWTGEGPATCATVAGSAKLEKTVSALTRSTRLWYPATTGAGTGCVWVTAVNSVGTSKRVLATGHVI